MVDFKEGTLPTGDSCWFTTPVAREFLIWISLTIKSTGVDVRGWSDSQASFHGFAQNTN